jgi:hypothetical protein
MFISTLVQLVAATAVLNMSEQQSVMAPVRIESTAGGANPIVISMVGVEQDPTPITARWNPAERCLSDVSCFVASWIEANGGGDQQRLVLLRFPDERADLEGLMRG